MLYFADQNFVFTFSNIRLVQTSLRSVDLTLWNTREITASQVKSREVVAYNRICDQKVRDSALLAPADLPCCFMVT